MESDGIGAACGYDGSRVSLKYSHPGKCAAFRGDRLLSLIGLRSLTALRPMQPVLERLTDQFAGSNTLPSGLQVLHPVAPDGVERA